MKRRSRGLNTCTSACSTTALVTSSAGADPGSTRGRGGSGPHFGICAGTAYGSDWPVGHTRAPYADCIDLLQARAAAPSAPSAPCPNPCLTRVRVPNPNPNPRTSESFVSTTWTHMHAYHHLPACFVPLPPPPPQECLSLHARQAEHVSMSEPAWMRCVATHVHSLTMTTTVDQPHKAAMRPNRFACIQPRHA